MRVFLEKKVYSFPEKGIFLFRKRSILFYLPLLSGMTGKDCVRLLDYEEDICVRRK